MLNEIDEIEALFNLMEAETKLDLFYSPFLILIFFLIFLVALREVFNFLKAKFSKYEKGIDVVALLSFVFLIHFFASKVIAEIKTEHKIFQESIANFEQSLSDKQRAIINTEIYLYLKESINKDEEVLSKNPTIKSFIIEDWYEINRIIGNDPNKLSKLTDKIYFDYFFISQIIKNYDGENSRLRENYTQYLNNDIREKVYN